jgi:hypothetical protein
MKAAGIHVVESPALIGETVRKVHYPSEREKFIVHVSRELHKLASKRKRARVTTRSRAEKVKRKRRK